MKLTNIKIPWRGNVSGKIFFLLSRIWRRKRTFLEPGWVGSAGIGKKIIIGFVLESFNGVGNQVGLTSGRKLYVDKNRGNVSYVDDTLVVAPFFVDTLLEITNITMMKQQWI